MTQEEHWKKAFQDLREKSIVELDNQRTRMAANCKQLTENQALLAAQIQASYERERDLANRLQAVLYWVEDDILTTLSEKALINVRQALQDFKDTRLNRPVTPKR